MFYKGKGKEVEVGKRRNNIQPVITSSSPPGQKFPYLLEQCSFQYFGKAGEEI